MTLAQKLIRSGLNVQTDVMERSMKAQMKQADRSNAEFLVVYGAEELAAKQFLIKRLSDGAEDTVASDDLAEFLLKAREK